MSANAMLDSLERECRELEMTFLSDICDLCHCPYVLHEDELVQKCGECTVYADLEALLKKERTVTTGRIMAIVAEEMHPEKFVDNTTQK